MAGFRTTLSPNGIELRSKSYPTVPPRASSYVGPTQQTNMIAAQTSLIQTLDSKFSMPANGWHRNEVLHLCHPLKLVPTSWLILSLVFHWQEIRFAACGVAT